MEIKRISICARCGIHRKDKSREFFGVWFVDLEKWEGWCPACAEKSVRAMVSLPIGKNVVPIPLTAFYSNGR